MSRNNTLVLIAAAALLIFAVIAFVIERSPRTAISSMPPAQQNPAGPTTGTGGPAR
jgi:hypothetical protein